MKKIKQNKEFPLNLPLLLLEMEVTNPVINKNIVFVQSKYYTTRKMICTGYNKIYYFGNGK